MKLNYLYILYSPQINQYYTGISHYPDKRLYYHNSSHKGWTRRGRPWKLVFTKSFNSQSQAQQWERWIKNQKDRSIIEKIIRKEFDWHI
jgi:putative endonuclease